MEVNGGHWRGTEDTLGWVSSLVAAPLIPNSPGSGKLIQSDRDNHIWPADIDAKPSLTKLSKHKTWWWHRIILLFVSMVVLCYTKTRLKAIDGSPNQRIVKIQTKSNKYSSTHLLSGDLSGFAIVIWSRYCPLSCIYWYPSFLRPVRVCLYVSTSASDYIYLQHIYISISIRNIHHRYDLYNYMYTHLSTNLHRLGFRQVLLPVSKSQYV